MWFPIEGITLPTIESLLIQEYAVADASTLSVQPRKVFHVCDKLLPLYSFVYYDISPVTIQHYSERVSAEIVSEASSPHHLYLNILHQMHDKLVFALWCVRQEFVDSCWTPRKVLELCSEQPHLKTFKLLGGLQSIARESVPPLLESDPASHNLLRGCLAIIEFVQFMYKCFPPKNVPGTSRTNLAEVEDLLKQVAPAQMQLDLLEDTFSLFFLRREDVIFEESSSESGENEELPPVRTAKRSHRYSEYGAGCSNSNSPNSQTGTSSSALAEKNEISLGYLCQQPAKLQVTIFPRSALVFTFFLSGCLHFPFVAVAVVVVFHDNGDGQLSLEMLERRVQDVNADGDLQLSLRRRRLEHCVKEALWRLQLLPSGSSRRDRAVHHWHRADGQVNVRRAWIARLRPAVQAWFTPQLSTGRKLRTKTLPAPSTLTDPRLINRLLADPR